MLDRQAYYVIEYYSRRLSASQRNYAPGKLELLALIVTLEHWRHYLKGAPKGLTIITDHEPLLAIKKTKNPSRMLLRWLAFIEQFNFNIQYRKGKENPADLNKNCEKSTAKEKVFSVFGRNHVRSLP